MNRIKNSPKGSVDGPDDQGENQPALELRLNEPDEINRHSGWDVAFRQIESGAMETRVAVRPSPDVTLLELHMDRAVHQLGCSPSGVVTFGLPLTPEIRSWRGADTEALGLLYFGTEMEFDGVSGPGFAGLTVSVSESVFATPADRIGLPNQDALRGKRSLPLRRTAEALDGLLNNARKLLYGPPIRRADLAREDLVAGLILAATDAEEFEDRSTYSIRANSVRRALDYLAERPGDDVSVSAICAATGASWRTLERGFREAFGIGPKSYVTCVRLGRVRSELLRGRVDQGVADAANAQGFWHMGQFAKDYRRMFGELPSQTLQGARSS